MNAADELRAMFEDVCELLLDNVDKHGYAIPVCLGHSPTGERFYVVAESEEDPEAALDVGPSIESISAQVRRMIQAGQLRSVAFARDLDLTVDGEKGPYQTAAIKVWLDHVEGGAHTAFLLYHSEDNKSVPDEVFYEAVEQKFFDN